MSRDTQHNQSEFEEKVIQISRVSKKTKGGNKVGFSVLMVVGDRNGKVGVALGKAQDVISAMRKGVKKAKKKMITLPLNGTTIPFPITVKQGAGVVMLKPAPRGSGVIAGGPVRSVVEAAGVRDISSKILGSQNKASSVYATFEALKQIKDLVRIKGIKLKSTADVKAEETQKLEILQKKAQETAQAHTSTAKEQKATTGAKKTEKAVASPKKASPAKKPATSPKKTTQSVKKPQTTKEAKA